RHAGTQCYIITIIKHRHVFLDEWILLIVIHRVWVVKLKAGFADYQQFKLQSITNPTHKFVN
ncbi:hypothetical protein B0181_03680, partial [Moraxella caviae]